MRRALPLLMTAALALAACKGKPQPSANTTDDAGAPQVATSIDDYELPVDKSAQITAIDAATGDASGMPRDGGAAVQAPKKAAAPAVPVATVTGGDNVQVPLIVPPPPVVTPAPGTN